MKVTGTSGPWAASSICPAWKCGKDSSGCTVRSPGAEDTRWMLGDWLTARSSDTHCLIVLPDRELLSAPQDSLTGRRLDTSSIQLVLE